MLMVGRIDPQRVHGRFLAERGDVGAHEAVGDVRDALEVHVLGQRHAPRVHVQDLQAADLVRHADLYLPVEPSAPAQRGVDGVGPVGGGHDDYLAAGLQAVHQGQQLGHDPALDFARDLLPLRRDGVDLVDEYDRRRVVLGFLEDVAELLLRLAVVLGHDLRAADVDEVSVRLAGHGFGDHGLAGAGRAEEHDALGRLDAQLLEDLRVPQRQLDHLPDQPDLSLQAADVLVGYVRGLLDLARLGRLLADGDLGPHVGYDRACRPGRRHHERHRTAQHLHPDRLSLGNGPAFQQLQEVVFASRDAHRLGGGERDALGRLRLYLLYLDAVVDAHPRVGSYVAIDENEAFAFLAGIARPDDGGRSGSLALDLDDVAADHAQVPHRLHVDAGDAPAHVPVICFLYS